MLVSRQEVAASVVALSFGTVMLVTLTLIRLVLTAKMYKS